MNNTTYQLIGHIPLIIFSMLCVVHFFKMNVLIGTLCGLILFVIFTHSLYIGLTDPEYTGRY